jgi:hypothetical protein
MWKERLFHLGNCNNLDADFGSWTPNAGFCISGLHHLDSISAAGDGLVAISLRALDKPFPARRPRLHDFDRKLTNCMEHDVLPIVLLYIELWLMGRQTRAEKQEIIEDLNI